MGMADYLSRHPSDSNSNENKIKAEELWHNWFTVNRIRKTDKFVSEMQKPHQKQNQPKGAKLASASDKQRNHTLASENEAVKANKQPFKQIAAITQTSQLSASTLYAQGSSKMSDELIRMADQPPIKTPVCSVNQIEVLQTLGNFTFASQYETDEFLQKIILLIKKPDSTKINRLPMPWREKFRCLSLDQHDFIYMDERLVIPKTLRPIILRSLHYGHPGRNVMLATVSNVWWPRLHREVIAIARLCPQCRESGKNIKTLLNQKQLGKLSECKESNQEIAIDFAGPFQNAINAKKNLLVSIDHFYGWPEAKFLRKPTTDNVIEFLKNYISRHGLPQVIRTDPATKFRSKRFKEFCKNRLIKHIACPIKDHRGNGKIEGLIRTINERLRKNKQIMVTKDKSGLSEILFALRMYPTKNGKSPYEKSTRKKPNTIKRLVINRDQFISEPTDFKLTETDFESRQDSFIRVRERTRGGKLEGAYKKRKGILLEQTDHTITFLPAGNKQSTFISKRDIAREDEENQLCCSKEADRRLLASRGEEYINKEQPHNSETNVETDESIQEIDSFPPEQPIRVEKGEKSRKKEKAAIEKLKETNK